MRGLLWAGATRRRAGPPRTLFVRVEEFRLAAILPPIPGPANELSALSGGGVTFGARCLYSGAEVPGVAEILLLSGDRQRAADVRSLLRQDGHAVTVSRDVAGWRDSERKALPEL